MVHQEASLEFNSLQTALNESNSKVAAKPLEISKADADLAAQVQQAANPSPASGGSATPAPPAMSEGLRFIDPPTG